ncbi:hypothetical protein SynNOUM97013_02517 [Synechococcus sp. NOUM97013]|nr:hypothetical protein SynNOUM97013_02517 [Synechococcus sp. NOUM97013]
MTPAFRGRGRGRIEKLHSGECSVPLSKILRWPSGAFLLC